MTKSKTSKLTPKNGRMALLISPSDIPPILEVTNRQTHTGGVVSPIIRLRTARMANWMGSISTPTAFFKRTEKRITRVVARIFCRVCFDLRSFE